MLDNWIWGLSLIALTIAVHVTGVTYLATVQHMIRVRLENLPHFRYVIPTLVAAFTAMTLLLAILHALEALVWAAAYLWVGALYSFGRAILYSVDSMATRGASGVTLAPHWQMLGALEAADGMVLFGISTAFIFTVMQFFYRNVLLERRRFKS